MKAISIALIFVLLAGAQQTAVQTPQTAAEWRRQVSGQHTAGDRDGDGEGQERQAGRRADGQGFHRSPRTAWRRPSASANSRSWTSGDASDGTDQTAGRHAGSATRPRHRPRRPSPFPGDAHQITPERPGDIRYRDRRLMAMYFDMSAMPVPDQIRARNGGDEFIKTQMMPADLMALMAFNGGGGAGAAGFHRQERRPGDA